MRLRLEPKSLADRVREQEASEEEATPDIGDPSPLELAPIGNPTELSFAARVESFRAGGGLRGPDAEPFGFNARFRSGLSPSEAARGTAGPVSYQRIRTGAVGISFQVAAGSPTINSLMTNVLQTGDSIINSTNEARSVVQKRNRASWLSLCFDGQVRRRIIRSINRNINTQSAELKLAMAAQQAVKPYWRTGIWGGGVHATEVAYAKALERDEGSVLIGEKGSILSGNFGTFGDTFGVNSSSRADKVDEAPGPGRGNLNPIEGPLGVPMIQGRKFVSTRAIADVTTIGAYASGSDFLMEEELAKIYDRDRDDPSNEQGWPGRYKCVTTSGLATYHDEVFLTTGLGEVVFDFADQETSALCKSENAKVNFDEPDELPGIMTFDNALRYAAVSDVPLEPYRRLRPNGKPPETAVVGFGDSGRVTLELLFRLGFEDAYTDGVGKTDVAQRGEVGPISWLVGRAGPATCEDYISQVRLGRYGALSAALKSGKVSNITARLDKIREVREEGEKRYELTYKKSFDYSAPDLATAFAEATSALGVDRSALDFVVLNDGSNRKAASIRVFVGEQTKVVDRVILAMGYKSKLESILEPCLPRAIPWDRENAERKEIEYSPYFRKFYGDLPDGRKNQVLGRQLRQTNIKLVGTAAGDDICPNEDTKGILENVRSIYALGPRSAESGRQSAREDTGPLVKFTWDSLRPTELLGEAQAQPRSVSLPAPRRSRPIGFGAEIDLKMLAAQALDRFRFRSMDRLQLEVEQTIGGIELRSSSLARDDLERIARAIRSDEDLLNLFAGFTRVGNKKVELEVPIQRAGKESGRPIFGRIAVKS